MSFFSNLHSPMSLKSRKSCSFKVQYNLSKLISLNRAIVKGGFRNTIKYLTL